MEQFLKEWNTLPPLVRASIAAHLALVQERLIDRSIQDERDYFTLHLDRRAEVTERFSTGHLILRDLFVKLAAEADNEAVSKGIDLDTKENKE